MRLCHVILFLFCPIFLFGQVGETSSLNLPDTTLPIPAKSINKPLNPKYFENNSEYKDIYQTDKHHGFLFLLSRLGLWHFQVGGVATKRRDIAINGLFWKQPETGQIDYNTLSLLYRTSRITSGVGLQPGQNAISGLDGWSHFSLKPLRQKLSTELGFTYSDGDYHDKLWLTYHTGRLNGGWAATFYFSKKWANEGYTPGTWRWTQGLLMSVSKEISKHHSLNLTVIGDDQRAAYHSPITKESATISGSYQYNPDWGYQSGEKRSVNISRTFLPAIILHYNGKFSKNTKLNMSVSSQTGISDHEGLDWYHAVNPNADYYKKMPSYYYLEGGAFNQNIGDFLEAKWQRQPNQIDWLSFYAANRRNKQSLFVLANDKKQVENWRFGMNVSHYFTPGFRIHAGIQILSAQSHHFRELANLLGGEYYVNLNQFAFRSFGQKNSWAQYDLRHPNREVKTGDKYYYNYLAQTRKGQLWLSTQFKVGQLKGYLAGAIGPVAYQRTGYYQNGIFPDASYGTSGWKDFLTEEGKAGIRWSINPAQNLSGNFLWALNAPTFNQTFFAPRIRNTTVDFKYFEKIKGLSINWRFHYQKWKANIRLFRSEITGQTKVLHFYHDGYQSFVDYVLKDVASRQTGIEGYFALFPTSFLEIESMLGWLQVFYSNRPEVAAYRENDTALIQEQQTVYWKNYMAVKGPQIVAGLSLKIYDKNWGYIRVSGSWQGRSYASLNPVRHTSAALSSLPPGSEQYKAILNQEKLPTVFLMNISLGKQFRLNKKGRGVSKNRRLYLSAGIKNLLNKKGYAIKGREQLRFDMDTQDPRYFPNQYWFGYGRRFYLSAALEIK